MPVLVTSNFDDDSIKNEGASMETNRIYVGVEAETRKSQARFQIIQVSCEALPGMKLE